MTAAEAYALAPGLPAGCYSSPPGKIVMNPDVPCMQLNLRPGGTIVAIQPNL